MVQAPVDPNLFHVDWNRLAEVRVAIIVLSFFVERALALVFENRKLVERLSGSGAQEWIALAVALMSLGLFYRERRNIQRCNVCTAIAHIVEESCGIRGLKQVPPGRMGKTGPEKLIYATIVMTWLAVPFFAGIPPNGTRPYVLASGIIVALTINAVFTSCEARPKVEWRALSDGNGKDGGSEARGSEHAPA